MFAESLPPWVKLLALEDGGAQVDVAPPFASGRAGKCYRLRILFGQFLRVWESEPGTLIPAFCPGRHINGDKSFCLGLERFTLHADSIADFWGKLRAYLLCQQYADVHGRWPTGRGLSHGDAAYHQIDAEAHATAAGLKESYRRAIEFGKGRLARDLSGLTSRLDEDHKYRSPRRAALHNLVLAEVRRREEDAAFLRWCRMTGNPCCETMQDCPMRIEQEMGE